MHAARVDAVYDGDDCAHMRIYLPIVYLCASRALYFRRGATRFVRFWASGVYLRVFVCVRVCVFNMNPREACHCD